VGAGEPQHGIILITPAYGVAGPNFIVREANGYLSREEIILTHAPTAGIFPEGLVLMLDPAAAAANEVKYIPFDGSGDAVGILYQMKDATAGDTSAVAVVRVCEVQRAMLKFADGVTDPQKETAYANLVANHVTLR
jgi:hypothetical protein